MRRALVAAALALLVFSCGPAAPSGGSTPAPTLTPSETPSVAPTATPSASPTTLPTPTPAPTPTPSATPPPSACASASGGDPAGSSAIAAVRVGSHAGYDRFVIEFAGVVPAWSVAPQASTTFTLSPKGTDITLAGTSGVLVTVQHVADWTSYAGPTSFAYGYPALREARLVQNFEAVTQWGLGVSSSGCPQAYQLSGPGRLVVDIPT